MKPNRLLSLLISSLYVAISCLSSCAVDGVALGYSPQGEVTAKVTFKKGGKNPVTKVEEPEPPLPTEEKGGLTEAAWNAFQKLLGK